MIKLTFCVRRLPTLSHEEFLRHWREVHAPLVRQHQKALGIVRYVQSAAVPGEVTASLRAFRQAPEPYDGIAEIWLESADALTAMATDPTAAAAHQALYEDERRFVDLARSPLWLAEERVVIGDTAENRSIED
ncbi:ethyl tert-butyl ether degradation protein EthD [Denitratisoma sp. DHT3]|uniref:EthD domain-containing protein n=1 Tax=Denitratisoma sp. DHT3 TaxID=1981880 RepID=UPI00119890B5|nr:EthD domain-containing protein [Denitratisoma sp. DHT3]QDX80181.1 ethyl tert-butyl ether degradation protein EthD [Denitratisoma sp. DHT3]